MKGIIKLKIILFFCVITTTLDAQGFQYKNISKEIISQYNIVNTLSNYNAVKKDVFGAAVDLSKYLPKDYSMDGDIDYTSYIQSGLDQNQVVILPNFPIAINAKGIKLNSNSKILFQPKTILKLIANSQNTYQMMLIDGVKNAEVYFANLQGDRYHHLDTKGEWGMGIWIKHSENIKIIGAKVTQCFGDGIYIGNEKKITSKNILIDGALIDDNRRNGISIISGKNIKIMNSIVANTNGTQPEAGIDIEPNTNDDILDNIVLDNIYTSNNSNRGVLMVFDNLIGNNQQKINITLNNHTDYGSKNSLEFFVDRGYKKIADNKLSGFINVNGLVYHNNLANTVVTNLSKQSNIVLNLKNVSIVNKNGKKKKFPLSINREIMSSFKNGRKLMIQKL